MDQKIKRNVLNQYCQSPVFRNSGRDFTLAPTSWHNDNRLPTPWPPLLCLWPQPLGSPDAWRGSPEPLPPPSTAWNTPLYEGQAFLLFVRRKAQKGYTTRLQSHNVDLQLRAMVLPPPSPPMLPSLKAPDVRMDAWVQVQTIVLSLISRIQLLL